MKRWIRPMLLCLLLGTMTTIAVAWGLAAFLSIEHTDRFKRFLMQSTGDPAWDDPSPVQYDVFIGDHDHRPFLDYHVQRWVRAGAHRVEVRRTLPQNGHSPQSTAELEEIIPAWGLEFLYIPELDPTRRKTADHPLQSSTRAVDARGWPALALWAGIREPYRGGDWTWHGAVPIEKPALNAQIGSSMRWLPLNPIWPGFIMNTLFYAAIWFALFAGFIGGKRMIRRKRGRCPKCDYDLRKDFDTGCPECGWQRRATP